MPVVRHTKMHYSFFSFFTSIKKHIRYWRIFNLETWPQACGHFSYLALCSVVFVVTAHPQRCFCSYSTPVVFSHLSVFTLVIHCTCCIHWYCWVCMNVLGIYMWLAIILSGFELPLWILFICVSGIGRCAVNSHGWFCTDFLLTFVGVKTGRNEISGRGWWEINRVNQHHHPVIPHWLSCHHHPPAVILALEWCYTHRQVFMDFSPSWHSPFPEWPTLPMSKSQSVTGWCPCIAKHN